MTDARWFTLDPTDEDAEELRSLSIRTTRYTLDVHRGEDGALRAVYEDLGGTDD